MWTDRRIQTAFSKPTLISNIISPETQIQNIFSAVRAKDIDPTIANSSAVLFSVDSTAPTARKKEKTKQTPAFTAGGNNDADMATPTRLLVFPPKTDKQTPIPDGIAMAIPVIKPVASPLICISFVGHSLAASDVKEPQIPTNAPMNTHPKSDNVSLARDRQTRGQSKIRLPNVRPVVTARQQFVLSMRRWCNQARHCSDYVPSTGPMMGDTNMDATITTVLLVMRPTPAKILAMVKSAM